SAALARGGGGSERREGRNTANAPARSFPEVPPPPPGREGRAGVTPPPPPAVPGRSPALAPAQVKLREAYADIEPYDPQRTKVELDLSDNTNLFGAPPAATRALAELASDQVTRYPPVSADELRAVLADK